MDLAEEYYKIDPYCRVCYILWTPELKSSDPEYVKRAYELQDGNTANFKIYTGLKKDDYYNLLADSKVLFNCAHKTG